MTQELVMPAYVSVEYGQYSGHRPTKGMLRSMTTSSMVHNVSGFLMGQKADPKEIYRGHEGVSILSEIWC